MLRAGERLDVDDCDQVRATDPGHRRVVDVLEEVAADRHEGDRPALGDRHVLRQLQPLHRCMDRDVEHLAVLDVEVGVDVHSLGAAADVRLGRLRRLALAVRELRLLDGSRELLDRRRRRLSGEVAQDLRGQVSARRELVRGRLRDVPGGVGLTDRGRGFERCRELGVAVHESAPIAAQRSQPRRCVAIAVARMGAALRRGPQEREADMFHRSLDFDVRIDRSVERIVIEARQLVGAQRRQGARIEVDRSRHVITLSNVCSYINTFRSISDRVFE